MTKEDPTPFELDFSGKWRPACDAAQLARGDFKTLTNMRYTTPGIRSVFGMSKINTTALATIDAWAQPAGYYIFYSAYDTGDHVTKQYYAYSATGTSWTVYEIDIGNDEVGAYYAPGLAVVNSGIYAATVKSEDYPNDDLLFLRCLDGVTWETTVLTSGGSQYGSVLKIPVEGTIYIVTTDWGGDGELKLWKSTDSGTTWASSTIASTAWDSNVDLYCIDANTLVVIYNGDGTDVRITRSTNAGSSWTEEMNVQADVVSYSETQSICGVGNTLWAAWADWINWPSADEEIKLYVAKSTDAGATWSDPVEAVDIPNSINAGWEITVRIRASDANTLVLTYDLYNLGTSAWNVGESHSADGGATWSAKAYIGLSGSVYHDATVTGSTFVSVHNDGYTDDSTGMLFSTSTDGGANWATVVADANVYQGWPRVVYWAGA